MAIIQLTNAMTEQESRVAQNSNNNYRVDELDNIIAVQNNLFSLVNIYSENAVFYNSGTRTFSYTVANLSKSFRQHATNVYFYISEKNGSTQVSSIMTATTTLAKQFTASSTERMIIPLFNNIAGTVYTSVIIDNFLKTYFASGSSGYLATYCGIPFMFENYVSGTSTIQRYSDGRMEQIYVNSFGSTPLTTAYGSIFRAASDMVWTFLIPFTSAPIVSKNLADAGIGDLKAIPTSTTLTFTPYNYTSATIAFTIQATAKGNWR